MQGLSFQALAHLLERLALIWKGSTVSKAGLMAVGSGAALLGTPAIVVAFAAMRGASGQAILESASPSLSIALLAVSLIIGGTAVVWIDQRKRKHPSLIAVLHQSFDGNARPLAPGDLPAAFRAADIITLPIAQYGLFRNGILESPKEALLLQSDFKAQLASLRRGHPEAPVAYCGKAHIPLAFTAGHMALSEVPLLHFELDRNNGAWRHLDAGASNPLDLAVAITPCHDGIRCEAVITVEISYSVDAADVAEIVPTAAARATIALNPPRLDPITHAAQVEEIAGAFRHCLDALQNCKRIHVFVAAPMSVVVALGRRLSPTIHTEVVVHNFTSKTIPRYAWGIHVNANGGPTIVSNGR